MTSVHEGLVRMSMCDVITVQPLVCMWWGARQGLRLHSNTCQARESTRRMSVTSCETRAASRRPAGGLRLSGRGAWVATYTSEQKRAYRHRRKPAFQRCLMMQMPRVKKLSQKSSRHLQQRWHTSTCFLYSQHLQGWPQPQRAPCVSCAIWETSMTPCSTPTAATMSMMLARLPTSNQVLPLR